MTEFSSRVEQVSISGIREVFEAGGAGIEAVTQPGGSVNDEESSTPRTTTTWRWRSPDGVLLNTDTGRRHSTQLSSQTTFPASSSIGTNRSTRLTFEHLYACRHDTFVLKLEQ